MERGWLVLENGRVFKGKLAGGKAPREGEVVFNTSINGYQEIITDPSYAGQIVVFTYPQIGNYGFGNYAFEADKPALQGMVIKEFSAISSHYESKWSLADFVEYFEVCCLYDVDTRAITKTLRTEGSMGAVITNNLDNIKELQKKAKKSKKLLESDLPRKYSTTSSRVYGNGNKSVVLWDLGVKQSIIKKLLEQNCTVITVPAATTAEEIMGLNPDGIVLSNGPGDPQVCNYVIKELKEILGLLPVLGICLGFQLLAIAMGANTYKMRYGHHGANHTVKDLRTQKCFISSQNHGYAVERDSLKGTGLNVIFENINDGTIEGLKHTELPILGVQFHPEASPGPKDTQYVFDEFMAMIGGISRVCQVI